MQSENYEKSEELFNQSIKFLESSSTPSTILLKSMTYNNLATLFIRLNNYPKALEALSQAEKDSANQSKLNFALTYINLAVLLRNLNKPQEALAKLQVTHQILKDSQVLTKNVLTSLVICLHNMGLLYNDLGQKLEFESSLRESWELAIQHFGPDHYLTQTVFRDLTDLASHSLTHVKIMKNQEIARPAFKEERKLTQILGHRPRQLSSGASELQQIRFLTGERLQPMHKTKFFRKVRSRPASRTANTASKVLKQKIIQSMRSDSHQLEGLGRIEVQLDSLQEKIDNFQEKCIPLKELAEDSEEYLSSKASVNEARLKNLRIQEEIRQKAAADIQKAVRGWRSRKRVKVVKEQEKKVKEATKNIVRAFKGFMGKIALREKWDELEAIMEQSEEREADLDKKMTEAQAALVIQTRFRGYVQRKKFKLMKKSAIKIQALVRMWLVKIIYKDVLKAIIMIQQEYRKHLTRKKRKLE